MSLFALRGPISVRGDLARPQMSVDAGPAAARESWRRPWPPSILFWH
jgi:hypothetical protein